LSQKHEGHEIDVSRVKQAAIPFCLLLGFSSLFNVCGCSIHDETDFRFHLIGSRLFLQQILLQLGTEHDIESALIVNNAENGRGLRGLQTLLLLREPYRIELGSVVRGTCGIPYTVFFESGCSFFVHVGLPGPDCPQFTPTYYFYSIRTLRESEKCQGTNDEDRETGDGKTGMVREDPSGPG
jgi:hypothetical protein